MFTEGEIAIAISILGRGSAEVELLYFQRNKIAFNHAGIVDCWRVLNLSENKEYDVRPENLRKKHEPGSWDDIENELGWNPTKEVECGISQ